jgi:SAM-dependent methyltransferase
VSAAGTTDSGTPSTTWEDAVRTLLADEGSAQLARDCYYDGTPLEAARRYAASDEWIALRGMLPAPGGEALDLGAGRGIASYALASAGWRVTAVEPDPSGLVGAGAIESIARDTGLPITVVRTTGERMPLPDASVDVVFARQALHHAADLRALCREVARVLRPGGTLLAAREHVISKPADLPAFLAAHPLHRLYGGENAYTLAQYRGALEAAGLRVDACVGAFESVVNYAPYTLATLRDAIGERLRRLPAGGVAAAVLLSDAAFPRVLRIANALDRRPGRLYTFVCRRAAGS